MAEIFALLGCTGELNSIPVIMAVGGMVMNRVIDEHTAELEQLCVRYRVRRLDLFGSATTAHYQPKNSDLDFLVEFHPLPAGAYADTYFGLLKDLNGLFGRPVDLVVGSAIRNPYFRQSVEATKTPIYEA